MIPALLRALAVAIWLGVVLYISTGAGLYTAGVLLDQRAAFGCHTDTECAEMHGGNGDPE